MNISKAGELEKGTYIVTYTCKISIISYLALSYTLFMEGGDYKPEDVDAAINAGTYQYVKIFVFKLYLQWLCCVLYC